MPGLRKSPRTRDSLTVRTMSDKSPYNVYAPPADREDLRPGRRSHHPRKEIEAFVGRSGSHYVRAFLRGGGQPRLALLAQPLRVLPELRMAALSQDVARDRRRNRRAHGLRRGRQPRLLVDLRRDAHGRQDPQLWARRGVRSAGQRDSTFAERDGRFSTRANREADPNARLARLRKEGGTSLLGLVAGMVVLVAAFVAALAAG